jgi:hypothetical protein
LYAELSDEELADASIERLRTNPQLPDQLAILFWRLMSRLASRSSFANPIESADDHIRELTHDFIVDKTKTVLSQIAAQRPRAGGVIGFLVTTMENWLTDRARQSVFGSMQHRLNQLLRARAEFIQVEQEEWWLASRGSGSWNGDIEFLHRAASRVKAPAANWSSQVRRAPPAAQDDLVAVLSAALEAAGGPLRVSVLTLVVLRRFPKADDPRLVSMSSLVTDVADPITDPAVEAVNSADRLGEYAEAWAIVAELSYRDRTILRHLDKATEIGPLLGLKRSQASLEAKRVREHVSARLQECADPEAVGLNLRQVCDEWV